MTADFKLTYSTMFDPPAALHERFEAALKKLPVVLGKERPMWVGGAPRTAAQWFEVRPQVARGALSERHRG
jgi:hypothetical protein